MSTRTGDINEVVVRAVVVPLSSSGALRRELAAVGFCWIRSIEGRVI